MAVVWSLLFIRRCVESRDSTVEKEACCLIDIDVQFLRGAMIVEVLRLELDAVGSCCRHQRVFSQGKNKK